MKPSELITLVIGAIEAQSVPTTDRSAFGDVFTGVAGPLPLNAYDRAFGVEPSVSIRRNDTTCPTKHVISLVIAFSYADTSDSDVVLRIADDMALVSEALHDMPYSGLANASDVESIEVLDATITNGQVDGTLDVVRGAIVRYTYD